MRTPWIHNLCFDYFGLLFSFSQEQIIEPDDETTYPKVPSRLFLYAFSFRTAVFAGIGCFEDV
jgi:hypothetical protein